MSYHGSTGQSAPDQFVRQLDLLDDQMALADCTYHHQAELGEVFTRRWTVELILDLVGFSSDRDLGSLKVIEPACGTGAFLVPLAERLIASARIQALPLFVWVEPLSMVMA